jgi:hypothetical protein
MAYLVHKLQFRYDLISWLLGTWRENENRDACKLGEK